MPDAPKNSPDNSPEDLSWLGLSGHKCALPKPGELVIVQCERFRCLGYYDLGGKWRNVRTAQELADVRGWCCIGDDTFTPVV